MPEPETDDVSASPMRHYGKSANFVSSLEKELFADLGNLFFMKLNDDQGQLVPQKMM